MATPVPQACVDPVIFATYAEDPESLEHVLIMAESIRTFAGDTKDAPIWLLVPDHSDLAEPLKDRLANLGVDILVSTAPEDSRWFYYAGKTFAAGEAERQAEGKAKVLVWMDDDTVVLRQPTRLQLSDGVALAYRPVMHNRSGSLASESPSPLWGRVFDLLGVRETDIFSMITPADQQTIRAYFNAGLIAVRPERGVLRKWGEDFTVLYSDPVLAQTCRDDITTRVFLHQMALVGAVLNILGRAEMVELPSEYNYPLFFEQMFDATCEFGTVDGIVSLRYDTYFRDPDPEWKKNLKGPDKLVSWLTIRLGK